MSTLLYLIALGIFSLIHSLPHHLVFHIIVFYIFIMAIIRQIRMNFTKKSGLENKTHLQDTGIQEMKASTPSVRRRATAKPSL